MTAASVRPETYWPSLILQIREINKWSHAEFASKIGSNQETVSRWERGGVLPSRVKQAQIEKIAEQLQLSSINGIATIVRLSPYPMLLCDRKDLIVAASASSGLQEGVPVLAQSPLEQHGYYKSFGQRLLSDGFWRESGQSRLYQFRRANGEVLSAVLVSINVRGVMYCVVQATPPAGTS